MKVLKDYGDNRFTEFGMLSYIVFNSICMGLITVAFVFFMVSAPGIVVITLSVFLVLVMCAINISLLQPYF